MQNQHHMMCRAKFPELESLVHHPIDYARVVKAIGNEMDITLIDTLEDILPQVRQSLLSFMTVRGKCNRAKNSAARCCCSLQ